MLWLRKYLISYQYQLDGIIVGQGSLEIAKIGFSSYASIDKRLIEIIKNGINLEKLN